MSSSVSMLGVVQNSPHYLLIKMFSSCSTFLCRSLVLLSFSVSLLSITCDFSFSLICFTHMLSLVIFYLYFIMTATLTHHSGAGLPPTITCTHKCKWYCLFVHPSKTYWEKWNTFCGTHCLQYCGYIKYRMHGLNVKELMFNSGDTFINGLLKLTDAITEINK